MVDRKVELQKVYSRIDFEEVEADVHKKNSALSIAMSPRPQEI